MAEIILAGQGSFFCRVVRGLMLITFMDLANCLCVHRLDLLDEVNELCLSSRTSAVNSFDKIITICSNIIYILDDPFQYKLILGR